MNTDLPTHHQHIRQLRQGDQESFKVLYDRYIDQLHAFVFRFTKSSSLSDDVVQDVFIKIWEKREQLDPEKSFRAYLYKIAKNQVLNLFARYATELDIQKEMRQCALHFANTTEDTLNFIETAKVIQEGISQLPPQQKRIFELCKNEGLTYEQAATELNLSASTINTQMVNALRFLKNYVSTKGSAAAAVLSLFMN